MQRRQPYRVSTVYVSTENLQKHLANSILFSYLSAQEPWPVAENVKRNILPQSAEDDLSTQLLVPTLDWVLAFLSLISMERESQN